MITQIARANAVRRIRAFAIDWLVMAVWGSLIFAAVMFATDGNPTRASGPWTAEGIGLLAMTLPVTLYFAVCESSRWQGSVGKRVAGLVVSRQAGGRLSFGRAFLRNAIKFAPWELGHLVFQQASFSGDGGFPVWVGGPAIVAVIGPLWWLVSLIMTGDTPYDRWVGARAAPLERSGSEP